MQALVDVDAELELDALRNVRVSAAHHGVSESAPCRTSSSVFGMRTAAFMTRWSFSVHFLGAPAIRQLQ